MSKPVLRLDWCSHEAAKYACEKWHYSRCVPKSKLAKVGVWEGGRFVGAVVFGVGATKELVQGYGLDMEQGCELVRVALTQHLAPTSQIVAIALKMLKRSMSGLRLAVSFADPEHGHAGIIYQAGGWLYTGRSAVHDEYVVNGRRWHGRAFRASKPAHLTTRQALALMDPNYQIIKGTSKHRYLMPLDDAMRQQIAPLAKPYPKRATSVASDAPANHAGEGGAIPTVAL